MPAPTQRRWAVPAFWTAVGSLTFAGAFVLPFAFPLRTPVMSAVYTAGGNNRVGTLAVACISVLVALACLRRGHTTFALQAAEKLSPRWLPAGSFVTLAFTFGLGAIVARAQIFWGDQGYFLTQLRTGLELHQPLYLGFEFAYGPLLYAWPAAFLRWLVPLGVSRSWAYLLSLATMQALGLALLFYTVDAVPLRKSLKAWAFALLTLGALTPMLGLNYTMFRFALPLAALVLLTRQPGPARAALVAALGEGLALAVSPELGPAFAAGAIAFALYRAFVATAPEHSLRWLWTGVAALAGAVAFVAGAGAGPFITLRAMAGGGFNLLLEPLPHVLLLLVAVVGLAPLAVAGAVRARAPQAGLLLAIYAASLALLPAAFGRADPLHVFFNGIGFYLLALLAAQNLGQDPGTQQRWRKVTVASLALSVLLTLAVNFALYRQPLLDAIAAAQQGSQPDPHGLDAAALHRAFGGDRVVLPLGAPEWLAAKLARWHQLQPGYFVEEVNLTDPAGELRQIAALRQADFALVPSAGLLFSEPIDNTRVKRWMRLGFVYPQRREPYVVGRLMTRELAAHWTDAGHFGAFTLYRRVD